MSDATDEALLARYLSGECSDLDRLQVEAWIREEPGRQTMVEQMRVVWETPEGQLPSSDVGELWHQVAQRAGIDAARPMRPRPERGLSLFSRAPARRLLRYAAVLVAAVGMPYLASRSLQIGTAEPDAASLITAGAETGQRAQVILGDGTVVTLDAGSTLTYPQRFHGGTRQVGLEGEGYFEVVADRQRPFVVNARHGRVEVLGTRFDVRAWGGSDHVEVAVLEGTVSLQGQDQDAGAGGAVVIAAGQVSVLPEVGGATTPRAAKVEDYLDWMRDTLVFEEAPLGDLLKRLERWYGVRFELRDRSVAREQVTVHLEKRSLEDALEVISALTGLACEREGDLIRLASR